MATVSKLKVHIADSLGGMRLINTTTENNLSDNGSAEAIYNTAGGLIGFRSYEGGFSLSMTIQVVAGDPSEPRYWELRKSREEVLLVLDFENGDRVRFRGVLSKYEPKGDAQGSVTASVEWALGSPDVLKHGNGPQRP